MTMQNIPVISIADLGDTATLAALDAACRDWGFFQVVEHGVPAEVTQALQQAMQRFFALPREAKRAILRTAENPWGYFDQELTKNTRDWKEVFDYGPPSGDVLRPQWPADLPGFREAVLDYYRACEALALRLLDVLSINLGMPADHLRATFAPEHSSFVRLNYYPPCPTPVRPDGLQPASGGYLGINHHTDSGVLTILLQDDQPGLEVYRHGGWHLVEPRRDAFVVNIGDVVQVWSNDRYRASLHRVVANTAHARYSAPFFLNPAYAAEYAPLPSMVDAANPPRYRAINWGEFRSRRAAGDYADYGEEVQISHYRI
ncbi:MAG TPA: 2OG-Fe(II) oxygenase family protein [Pseudomonadales bacterium]